jgi:hypothetical protein
LLYLITCAGSVYVFHSTNGVGSTVSEAQKLLASDGTASASFGSSVSVYDYVLVVGAKLDDSEASDAGRLELALLLIC